MRPSSARSGSSIQNPKSKIQNGEALPLALLTLALSALGGCSRAPSGPWKTDEHFIQQHRSGRAFAPVETAPAFADAVRAGADALDVDLRATADNVIVCCHDGWVMTRECFGAVEDLDWATLARADVGWEFDPKSAGVRVVTFDEFVRFCAGNRLRFHAESKAGDRIAPAVLATIDRYDAMPLCSGLDGFKAPKRDDYRPVNIGVNTQVSGGDDDRRWLRPRVFRHEGAKLKINIDDCRVLADLLGRDGGRRPLGAFRLEPPPAPGPEPSPGVSGIPADVHAALELINGRVRRGDRAALASLRLGARSSGPVRVRAACVWALGRMRDAESYAFIEAAAKSAPSENDFRLRCAATWALSEFDRDEAVEALAGILEAGLRVDKSKEASDRAWQAEYAARALGRCASPAAAEVLGRALRRKPDDRYVTQEIAAALARRGQVAIPHLVACLDEDRPAHRREILWALLRLQGDSADAVARELARAEDPVVRRNGLRLLACCDNPTLPVQTILDGLDSTSPEVRSEAAWVCGKHRIRQAEEKLKGMANDEDEFVKREVAESLRRIAAR